ncbi:MAG: hypothetical protein Ct9H300mP21_00310 [Pseudomonadota bacterium]|nr:MAG: hypothetical protein Ct9H300mP21_00310 [Pseudomonadota bacterium]
MNFGPLPMCNELTRLQTRFLNDPENVENFPGKNLARIWMQFLQKSWVW